MHDIQGGQIARRPRLYGEDLYHHIYAWGNNRQPIFVTDKHYKRYINFLEKYGRDNQIEIIAYALMQTHIHLFVHDRSGKVSQFMNSLHGEYAQYFNHVTGRVGHVFGERFNSKVVQANKYGIWLSRYIHLQAVEAGLVTDPSHYAWTSYRRYLGEEPLEFIKPDVVLAQFGNSQRCTSEYAEFVTGTRNEPIDWELGSIAVIGDTEFQRDIQERGSSVDCANMSDEEIFRLIAERFMIEPKLMTTPHGWYEKRLRRKVIRYLVDEIGLKPKRIMKLCHISRMTVQGVFMEK
jgi:putative transposase